MYRDGRLLKIVRESPCQHCGAQDGTVCAAHSNQYRDGKGMGQKANDYRVAALCFKCHASIDQGSKLSYEERIALWEAAHRATIAWLFDNGHIGFIPLMSGLRVPT